MLAVMAVVVVVSVLAGAIEYGIVGALTFGITPIIIGVVIWALKDRKAILVILRRLFAPFFPVFFAQTFLLSLIFMTGVCRQWLKRAIARIRSKLAWTIVFIGAYYFLFNGPPIVEFVFNATRGNIVSEIIGAMAFSSIFSVVALLLFFFVDWLLSKIFGDDSDNETNRQNAESAERAQQFGERAAKEREAAERARRKAESERRATAAKRDNLARKNAESLFRRAMQKIHPDRAPKHLQGMCEKLAAKLNAARKAGDYKKIAEIA